jgi:hypothetical protein
MNQHIHSSAFAHATQSCGVCRDARQWRDPLHHQGAAHLGSARLVDALQKIQVRTLALALPQSNEPRELTRKGASFTISFTIQPNCSVYTHTYILVSSVVPNSHMCALHEALCKELATYGQSPPAAGRRMMSEKKRAWFGTGDAVAMERTDVAQDFFDSILRIVEVAHPHPACAPKLLQIPLCRSCDQRTPYHVHECNIYTQSRGHA